MSAKFTDVVPILPCADVAVSLAWWTGMCGFAEDFRHGEPTVFYAGISSGGASLHLSLVDDAKLARTVGDQTMVRLIVDDLDAMHAGYLERGGTIHPNGALTVKPWGMREFGAIDPNGVCVTFVQGAEATAS